MRASTAQRAIESVVAEIEALAVDFGPLVEILRQSQPGPTAQRLDLVGRSVGAVSDRTAGEAIDGHDRATADLAAIEAALRQLVAATVRLGDVRRSWLGERATKARFREGAGRSAVEAAPRPAGCSVMATIGHFEPVVAVTDVGGVLPSAQPLGRWARDFIGRHGRLPTEIECRARAAGRKPRVATPQRQQPA